MEYINSDDNGFEFQHIGGSKIVVLSVRIETKNFNFRKQNLCKIYYFVPQPDVEDFTNFP